jgi:hypothetical protein
LILVEVLNFIHDFLTGRNRSGYRCVTGRGVVYNLSLAQYENFIKYIVWCK